VTSSIPIFVNDRCLHVPPGTTLGEALADHEPELFAALLGGTLRLTDGRAIPVDPGLTPAAGAIFRARQSARLGGSADA
jgi:hypothetical protein